MTKDLQNTFILQKVALPTRNNKHGRPKTHLAHLVNFPHNHTASHHRTTHKSTRHKIHTFHLDHNHTMAMATAIAMVSILRTRYKSPPHLGRNPALFIASGMRLDSGLQYELPLKMQSTNAESQQCLNSGSSNYSNRRRPTNWGSN